MVNKSTLIRDSVKFVKDTINDNVTDPISDDRSSKSKFVLTAYPLRPVEYPIITVRVTDVSAIRSGMQTTAQDINLTFEVRIWARNEVEKNDLYEDILNALTGKQFTDNGSVDSNLHNLNSPSAVEINEDGESGGQVIKSRVITFNYDFYNVS